MFRYLYYPAIANSMYGLHDGERHDAVVGIMPVLHFNQRAAFAGKCLPIFVNAEGFDVIPVMRGYVPDIKTSYVFLQDALLPVYPLFIIIVKKGGGNVKAYDVLSVFRNLGAVAPAFI